MPAQSAAATAKTLATAKQYNDLRNDVLSTTLGHMHDGTNGRVHTDDTILALGTDSDIALVLRSTILAANTALTGVLVGTPVTPAVAANSLILSNITASGDILLAGNLGGNSRAYLFADVSADTLDLYTAGVSRIALAAGGGVTISGALTLSAAGTALTVNNNALISGTLTVSGSSVSITGATGNTLVVDTSTLVVDATNNRVGIGQIAPTERLHISDATLPRIRLTNDLTGHTATDGFEIGIENLGSAWVQVRENIPLRIFTNSLERVRLEGNGNVILGGAAIGAGTFFYTLNAGVQLGQPTGGDKGAGTMNAIAVYDDNVLLTDWIFDRYYGSVVDRGMPEPQDARLWSLIETSEFTQQHHRLPWMPAWEQFENERSLGKMVTNLWQGQEYQQLHLFSHEERLQSLEQENRMLTRELTVLREGVEHGLAQR